jgi:hypothetical protein
MAGWPEHDPVARGLAEPGVRRLIVPPDVRLDLDDPAAAPSRRVVADEPCADERGRGLERGAREDGPVEDAQPNV